MEPHPQPKLSGRVGARWVKVRRCRGARREHGGAGTVLEHPAGEVAPGPRRHRRRHDRGLGLGAGPQDRLERCSRVIIVVAVTASAAPFVIGATSTPTGCSLVPKAVDFKWNGPSSAAFADVPNTVGSGSSACSAVSTNGQYLVSLSREDLDERAGRENGASFRRGMRNSKALQFDGVTAFVVETERSKIMRYWYEGSFGRVGLVLGTDAATYPSDRGLARVVEALLASNGRR